VLRRLLEPKLTSLIAVGDARVAAGERYDDLAGTGIYLSKVGPANSIGPIDVLDTVTDHGTRTDNVGKLAQAVADDRNLRCGSTSPPATPSA
jgi:hypothetical protein